MSKLWSTFSLHIGHIPETLNDPFTVSGWQVFSKALVKIEEKVLFIIKTSGYCTENDATSLVKFDLKNPKNPLSAVCTACNEWGGKQSNSILLSAQNWTTQ